MDHADAMLTLMLTLTLMITLTLTLILILTLILMLILMLMLTLMLIRAHLCCSGLLVSFLYFRTTSKVDVNKITNMTGLRHNILEFIGLLVYRFLRYGVRRAVRRGDVGRALD